MLQQPVNYVVRRPASLCLALLSMLMLISGCTEPSYTPLALEPQKKRLPSVRVYSNAWDNTSVLRATVSSTRGVCGILNADNLSVQCPEVSDGINSIGIKIELTTIYRMRVIAEEQISIRPTTCSVLLNVYVGNYRVYEICGDRKPRIIASQEFSF
ncbi:hypothetical protein MNBD_GAMMA26-287 [hydrothermal vent metagenome]|uniref:Uncharacterized protein n=1 Tax=hydrothermal vent metagenome TaxID=652676 RepID=A0A3B1BDL1_9ZZZZ